MQTDNTPQQHPDGFFNDSITSNEYTKRTHIERQLVCASEAFYYLKEANERLVLKKDGLHNISLGAGKKYIGHHHLIEMSYTPGTVTFYGFEEVWSINGNRYVDNFMGAVELKNLPIIAVLFWDGKKDSLDKCVCNWLVFHNNSVLFDSFQNGKLHLSPFTAPDSEAAVIDLLRFVAVQPGDTDEEYFDNYTIDQRSFAKSYECEQLSNFCSDYEQGERYSTDYKYY